MRITASTNFRMLLTFTDDKGSRNYTWFAYGPLDLKCQINKAFNWYTKLVEKIEVLVEGRDLKDAQAWRVFTGPVTSLDEIWKP